jgi:hypothetical protein
MSLDGVIRVIGNLQLVLPPPLSLSLSLSLACFTAIVLFKQFFACIIRAEENRATRCFANSASRVSSRHRDVALSASRCYVLSPLVSIIIVPQVDR